jgi:hypothetical protein
MTRPDAETCDTLRIDRSLGYLLDRCRLIKAVGIGSEDIRAERLPVEEARMLLSWPRTLNGRAGGQGT